MRKASFGLLLVGVCAAVIFATHFFLSFGYRKFLLHGSAYYAQVAAGCDKLRSQKPTVGFAEGKALAKETALLSPEIRSLNPDAILVTDHSVSLVIGQGISTYQVIWSRDQNGDQWELGVFNDGVYRAVFRKK